MLKPRLNCMNQGDGIGHRCLKCSSAQISIVTRPRREFLRVLHEPQNHKNNTRLCCIYFLLPSRNWSSTHHYVTLNCCKQLEQKIKRRKNLQQIQSNTWWMLKRNATTTITRWSWVDALSWTWNYAVIEESSERDARAVRLLIGDNSRVIEHILGWRKRKNNIKFISCVVMEMIWWSWNTLLKLVIKSWWIEIVRFLHEIFKILISFLEEENFLVKVNSMVQLKLT